MGHVDLLMIIRHHLRPQPAVFLDHSHVVILGILRIAGHPAVSRSETENLLNAGDALLPAESDGEVRDLLFELVLAPPVVV